MDLRLSQSRMEGTVSVDFQLRKRKKTDEEEEVMEESEEMKEEEEDDNKGTFLGGMIGSLTDTILYEEVHSLGDDMTRYRKLLALAVLQLAEKEGAEQERPKLDKFVDSFRAGWKEFRKTGDEKACVDTFMKHMESDLWYSPTCPCT